FSLRVTKYHALPSTTTIVAMKDDRVLATVSIIRDGSLGFPSSQIIDTTHLRSGGKRVAEISALAVHRDYRESRGELLWPLLVYMYRYCTKLFGVDSLLISVHPSHFPFYEALLGFKPLMQTAVSEYEFANNNAAICGVLDLREAYDR